MESDQRFSLKWNNYQNHLVNAFESLLGEQQFVDVTLGCEGKKLSAHKMLLSACSPYFRDLLKDNPCQHPIIILRDVSYDDLRALLQFIYNGEVNVAQEQLNSFLKSAESLKVRGLTDNPDEGEDYGSNSNSQDESSSQHQSSSRHRSHSGSNSKSEGRTNSYHRSPGNSEVANSQSGQSRSRKRVAADLNQPEPSKRLNISDQRKELNNSSVKQEVIDIPDDPLENEENAELEEGGGELDYGHEDEEGLDHQLAVPGEHLEEEGSAVSTAGFWQTFFEVNIAESKGLFSCNICGKEFRNEGSLAQHRPIHRVNTTCELCGTTLSRVQHYRRHLRTVHNIDTKTMNVSKVGQKTASPTEAAT